jgi:hypothetical protein
MQTRPTTQQIMAALGVAERAVLDSQATRRSLGRRKTKLRQKRLAEARQRCAEAAKPLRSYIGMAAWEGISLEDELLMKRQMERLRYERRQLDKMLARYD